MLSMLRTCVLSAVLAAGGCDTIRAWIQLDGTMSFDAYIKDRAKYLTELVGGLKSAGKDVDFGYSVFGDRQATSGPTETCYSDVGGFGSGTTPITAFFGGYKSVTDGDDPEDSLSTAVYIAGTKFPEADDVLKVLITVTDATSKTEGEGGSLEGSTALDDPLSCITCDSGSKLVSKRTVVNALKTRGIAHIVLTKKEATDYWKGVAKATGRGAVLISTTSGTDDAKKIITGLSQFSCGGGGGGGSKKKGKGKTIAIALIITVLLLAALLGAGWWFMKKRSVTPAAAPAAAPPAARKPTPQPEEEEEEEEWNEDEGEWDEEEGDEEEEEEEEEV